MILATLYYGDSFASPIWQVGLKDTGFRIASSSIANPVQVTTTTPNNLTAGQKISIQGSPLTSLTTNNGNATIAAIVDSSNFTLTGIAGFEVTNGGSIYSTSSGAGLTNSTLICNITASATQGAAVLIAGTLAWIDQSVFLLNFTFDETALYNAITAPGTYHIYFYYTDTSGNIITAISGDIVFLPR